MLKKAMVLAATLGLITLLTAPWVLAQQEEDASVVQQETPASPRVAYLVNCGPVGVPSFADYVGGRLPVYNNGLVGLPDGTMVPLSEIEVTDTCAVPLAFGTQNEASFLQYLPAPELCTQLLEFGADLCSQSVQPYPLPSE